MPRISEFLGIYIYMYFSDHNPPHIHAIYGQFEAEFRIEDGEVMKGSLPLRARRLVSEWMSIYKEQLFENWNRSRDHQPLMMIPPLE